MLLEKNDLAYILTPTGLWLFVASMLEELSTCQLVCPLATSRTINSMQHVCELYLALMSSTPDSLCASCHAIMIEPRVLENQGQVQKKTT